MVNSLPEACNTFNARFKEDQVEEKEQGTLVNARAPLLSLFGGIQLIASPKHSLNINGVLWIWFYFLPQSKNCIVYCI